jgi:hypothetical protein
MPSPMTIPLLVHTLVLASLSFASAASAQTAANTRDYNRAIGAAVSAYNEGHFEQARAHFAEAHALRPNARTWRGLGTSDFELGNYRESIQELELSLEDMRVPLTPELRVKTQAVLQNARERVAPPPAPEVLPPPTVEEPLPAPVLEPVQAQLEPRWLNGLRIGAITSLAVSAVGFGLAAGFGLKSIHDGRTRDDYCDRDGACRDVRGVRAGNDARSAGNIATAGWVIGGAGLASAVVFWWRDRVKHRADQASAQLRVGPTSLSIVGAF